MTTPAPHSQPKISEARQHTPLPWLAEPNAYGTWFIYRAEETETAPTGLRYRQLVCGGDGYQTLTEANASLIVESVNNHARLTDRCEQYKGQVKAGSDEIDALKALLSAARQALEYSLDMNCTDPGGALLQTLNRLDRALSPDGNRGERK